MRPLKMLIDMIVAFVFGLFLWFAVNSVTAQHGMGWLESARFPLNSRIVSALIFSAVIGFSDFVGMLVKARRQSDMQTAAALMGLAFEPTPDPKALNLEMSMDLFENWHELRNVMTGRIGGTELTALELVTRIPASGDSSESYQEKSVILFKHDGSLPGRIAITHVGRLSGLVKLAGLSPIIIQSSPDTDALEPDHIVKVFNQRYLVSSGELSQSLTDENASLEMELEKIQNRIESVLSRPLLQLLTSGRGYSIEVGERQVAISIALKISRRAGITNVVSEVVRLFETLMNAVNSPKSLTVRINPDSVVRVATKTGILFAVFALGGVGGMFLAFALFAPIFFLFVEDYPWIVFLWPFFGMAVMIGSITLAFRILVGVTK